MLYRKVYLEKDRTLGDSGEYTVDITPLDPITMMWVKFQANNGATQNIGSLLPQCINAIEIIDGADVIYSLDGAQAVAQCAYDAMGLAHSLYNESPNEAQTAAFPIWFGRYLGDTELALDTSKFTNLQVRVNWNLAAVHAVGATGYVTGSMQLSVVPTVMVGAPSPRGVLSSKEIYTYTTAAAGTEYIDLPTDEPYRRLLLRGVKATSAWHWDYDNIKLSFDGGKFVPFDMRGWDIIQSLSDHYPRFGYHHRGAQANNTVMESLLKHEEMVNLQSSVAADTVCSYLASAYGSAALRLFTAGGAAGVIVFDGEVQGWAPFGCVAIPFGDPNVIADWLPTPTFKSARLEVHAGVADAANAIVLQTLRTY